MSYHKTVRIDPDADAWLQAIMSGMERMTGVRASKAQVVARALKYFGEATGVEAPAKVERPPWGGPRVKGVSKKPKPQPAPTLPDLAWGVPVADADGDASPWDVENE